MGNAEWVWVPVTEILCTINSSIDIDSLAYVDSTSPAYEVYEKWARGEAWNDDDRTAFWESMIVEKAADSGFGRLLDSIQQKGWKSAISWNPDTKYLGNGHHRMVAAILLCEDAVPTTVDGSVWSSKLGETNWDKERGIRDGFIVCYHGSEPIHMEGDQGWHASTREGLTHVC